MLGKSRLGAAAVAGLMVMGSMSAASFGVSSSAVVKASGSQNGPSHAVDVLKGAADRRTSRVRLGEGGVFGGAYRRRGGYGWTNMHQRRVATKKRNVQRHRKAAR